MKNRSEGTTVCTALTFIGDVEDVSGEQAASVTLAAVIRAKVMRRVFDML
ncbi:hypothetical protein GCM10009069_08370 [Algimonas arctica]|uniref:Uncharacterized protein n=1 Tax=Algimonas arctica TaxID=1479486 RepID=A0A8J3G1P0_9PROT|nr:hypothetical protein GCM10009069_08370 [Algimonas arctica]